MNAAAACRRSGSAPPPSRSSLPGLPARLARRPLLLQHDLVAEAVHVLPVARVPVGGQLAVIRQALKGLALPDRLVALDVVEDAGLEDEEAPVDPATVAGGLLAERLDPVSLERERTEAAGRLDRRQGREHALLAVEFDEGADVDVRDAVAVGEAERFFSDGLLRPLQPAARHRLVAGAEERHAPWLDVGPADFHRVRREVEGDIGPVEEV